MRTLARAGAIPGWPAKLVLWGAATWAVLHLHESAILRDHSICGPWGCGPTVPALLAAHGFWLMVAVPSALWASRRLAPRSAIRLGSIGLGLAGLGVMVVVTGSLAGRPHFTPPGTPSYTVERALFALATTVQVPLFPTALAGLILLVAGRRGMPRSART